MLAEQGSDERRTNADMRPSIGLLRGTPGHERLLLSLTDPQRLRRLLAVLFNEAEFLSPHGLRALSAWHRDHPYTIEVEGYRASIDYEPAESTTPLFGGNSNWRGPVWFPVNYLIVSVLERYQHCFSATSCLSSTRPGPADRPRSARSRPTCHDRLISIFTPGPDGHRPCFGGVAMVGDDPAWRDNVVFSEYFHGDTGSGLGASHQTGWTGLVADLIRRRHGAVPSLGAVLAAVFEQA